MTAEAYVKSIFPEAVCVYHRYWAIRAFIGDNKVLGMAPNSSKSAWADAARNIRRAQPKGAAS